VTPQRGVRLAPYTSLRVGGPADFFLEARSTDELVHALQWARANDIQARVIGGGSNLLVAEAGVDGLVVKAANAKYELDGTMVRAEAGVNFANLARRLAKQAIGGLEWAANVPGTVGGAAVNNAGAFGSDTASVLDCATLVDADGNVHKLRGDELEYAYRTSRLKRRDMGTIAVVEVVLRVQPNEQADRLVKEFNAQRMRSQPRIKSAGSVFANPPNDFSGRLIEAAGLKGQRVGGAQISEQHANFIVNPGEASADDVFALMRQAQCAVYERTSIVLRAEIELFGRWTDEQRAAVGHG
jgi:UDP-N-acetylmuramate dehydrogenase